MLYVRLIQSGPWEYDEVSCTSVRLHLLERFLGKNVTNKVGEWKEWLAEGMNEPSKNGKSVLVTKNDDVVVMSDLFTGQADEIPCEFKIKQLFEILDKWNSLCKNNAQQIIILEEKDRIELKGEDEVPVKPD